MKPFEGFDFFLSQTKPNLKVVTEYAFGHLLEQYEQIIGQAGKQLIQSARELRSEGEKARFIAAIEQVQRLKNGMVNTFGLHLMESWRILHEEPMSGGIHSDIQGSQLSMSHGRDDDILLFQTIDRTKTDLAPWLLEINAGLQKTLPTVRITDSNNPFSPIAIGNALHASMKLTTLPSPVKKVIYTLFRDQLFAQLGPVYQKILQEMREAGIRVGNPAGKAVTSVQPAIVEEDIPMLQPETQELDIINSGFNDLIEEGAIPPDFHNFDFVSSESTPAEKGITLRPAQHKEIDALLANIQKGYEPASDGELPAYIRSHLAIESKPKEKIILSRHDENIIHLISLVFDQIAETQSEKMGKLFLRLKVPYTRIVLGDELFFHDQTHAARQCLDRLLVLTFSSHDDELLYKQVQTCVLKILMRYSGEQQLFRDLVATVEGYLESNAGPYKASQEAMTAKLEADEKRRMAATSTREMISKRTATLARRLRFHVLVEKIWEELLVTILLAQGTESKAWQLAVKLLDIILFLTAKGDTPQFRKLTEELPTIAAKLGQFLLEQKVSLERKELLVNQLLEIQRLLAQGKTLRDLDDDELSHTFDIDMVIDEYESEVVGDIDTARIGSEHRNAPGAERLTLIPKYKRPKPATAQAFVDNLVIGKWMNFIVDGRRTPCTPSYFSRQKGTYTFCDRHNQKIFERKKEEIVNDILAGFACPLENTLNFEDNLARVVSRITPQ